MLTDNVSVSDRLTVHLAQLSAQIGDQSLCSTIYKKFDDPKAGNSLKDRRVCGELKESVPITARVRKFLLKKGKSIVVAERKQFLLILGHAITVHKSQGSTLTCMQGDLKSIYW